MGGPRDATALYDELYLLFDDYVLKNSKQPSTYESLFRKKEFLQFAELHGTHTVPTPPKEVINNKDEIIDELIYAFKIFAKYISSSDIFSKNEEADDINTKHLRFLFIPYILGALCYETINIQIRSDRLKDSKLFFGEFVNLVSMYRIAPVDDYLLDQLGDTSEAINRRNIKIKRAKDEKKFQEFYNNIIKMKVKKGTSPNCNLCCFDEDLEEEELREVCLSLIKCKCLQTLNMLDLIDTELEVLEMRSRQNANEAKQQQNGQLTSEARQPHLGKSPPSNHPNGGLKKPWLFTIKKNMPPADVTQMRKYYRDLVFTPAHNLPTISLEECAKIEMEYALKGSRGASRGGSRGGSTLGSEDERGGQQNGADEDDHYKKSSQEESEKEAMDREWDDWKDMHQKGMGNKNRNVA